jgi:hypothetical protein
VLGVHCRIDISSQPFGGAKVGLARTRQGSEISSEGQKMSLGCSLPWLGRAEEDRREELQDGQQL